MGEAAKLEFEVEVKSQKQKGQISKLLNYAVIFIHKISNRCDMGPLRGKRQQQPFLVNSKGVIIIYLQDLPQFNSQYAINL